MPARLPVFIAHDGIRTAVRAVRHLVAREHRLFLAAQAADRISFQFGQQRCVACTGHEIAKHCRLALNIIHAEHIYCRYTLYDPRQILLCVICPNILGQQRRVCRHLRRIGQQLVARPHLLMQARCPNRPTWHSSTTTAMHRISIRRTCRCSEPEERAFIKFIHSF